MQESHFFPFFSLKRWMKLRLEKVFWCMKLHSKKGRFQSFFFFFSFRFLLLVVFFLFVKWWYESCWYTKFIIIWNRLSIAWNCEYTCVNKCLFIRVTYINRLLWTRQAPTKSKSEENETGLLQKKGGKM